MLHAPCPMPYAPCPMPHYLYLILSHRIMRYVRIRYYSLRLNEDWQEQYPHLREWFKKLHSLSAVQSTIPIKT